MLIRNQFHWTKYYKEHATPANPSLFAQFICQKYIKSGTLVELGCGNGRDSVFFAENKNLFVKALDICSEEIAFLNENYSKENLSFTAQDFSRIESLNAPVDYIYSRFTLHSVNEEQETATLLWCYANLKKDGYLFIEVRGLNDPLYGEGTKVDGEEHAFVTDHYRRFVSFDVIQAKLKQIGFQIDYAEESSGFAPYENVDPMVIRIVAQKH